MASRLVGLEERQFFRLRLEGWLLRPGGEHERVEVLWGALSWSEPGPGWMRLKAEGVEGCEQG